MIITQNHVLSFFSKEITKIAVFVQTDRKKKKKKKKKEEEPI